MISIHIQFRLELTKSEVITSCARSHEMRKGKNTHAQPNKSTDICGKWFVWVRATSSVFACVLVWCPLVCAIVTLPMSYLGANRLHVIWAYDTYAVCRILMYCVRKKASVSHRTTATLSCGHNRFYRSSPAKWALQTKAEGLPIVVRTRTQLIN